MNSFVVLKIDGSLTDTENVTIKEGRRHDFNETEATTTILQWNIEDNLTGGEEIEVWIKYVRADSNENTGTKKSIVAKNLSKDDDSDSFKIAGQDGMIVIGAGLGAASIAGVILFVKLRGREEEYEEFEEEEYEEEEEEYEDDESEDEE